MVHSKRSRLLSSNGTFEGSFAVAMRSGCFYGLIFLLHYSLGLIFGCPMFFIHDRKGKFTFIYLPPSCSPTLARRHVWLFLCLVCLGGECDLPKIVRVIPFVYRRGESGSRMDAVCGMFDRHGLLPQLTRLHDRATGSGGPGPAVARGHAAQMPPKRPNQTL